MFKPFGLILLLTFFNHPFAKAQSANETAFLGLKNILSGNFDTSVNVFSKAIRSDSLNWENYYFRGIARTYLADTVNCLSDFFKAVDLKKKHPRQQTDSIIISWLSAKPVVSRNFCSMGLSNTSHNFFQIWLGSWLLLNQADPKEACDAFTNAKQDGIWQLRPYLLKHCNK